ncbi:MULTISPECIES: PAS domain-containing protein [Microvirgula]|uniref:PAS domain S-box protein n=1 Tax=Microvirgula aerodenitrificans TaxID=57480 RepID=A0A2S0PB34_9NEIS|nr:MULTISPECIES: PAS domain-containing protein [Microvirgula]AVY94523.1 PAS domain S-box protein [Microvirgula aerodenitrificans]RAS19048.1 aerotaxis receptor [Microvirgula sp. AG722]
MNNQEVRLQPDDLIITKTDQKGIITYANRKFMQVSNYAESALLGQAHNLIRHPDMPRGVFRLMWKTLMQGKEFFGILKNYTADGGFYWVFANVTPDYGIDGSTKGYYSVRRMPTRHAIDTMTRIYAEMRAVEQSAGKAAAPDTSLAWLQDYLDKAHAGSYENFVLGLNK